MKTILLPRKVVDKLSDLGYKKSKKGKWYKKYDSEEEFIAMPSCKEIDGAKRISWFIFTTEQPKRKLHISEAREISEQFDEDGIEVEELIRGIE